MRAPRNKKEVRSFLGMVGYYRRFIPHFTTTAEPLTNLMKKDQPDKVEWTERTEEAFQILKRHLMDSVILRNPDYSQTFQLQIDASDVGVGAVLSQGETINQWLTSVQNYSTGRRVTPPSKKSV